MSDFLSAMQSYRAERFRSLPGLEPWWQALTDNLGTTLQVVQQDNAAREALGRLLAATPAILENPDQPLDPVHVDDAMTVLDTLSREKPTVRRAFARRGAMIVADLEGKSWNDAAERIADVPPLGRRRPDRKT